MSPLHNYLTAAIGTTACITAMALLGCGGGGGGGGGFYVYRCTLGGSILGDGDPVPGQHATQHAGRVLTAGAALPTTGGCHRLVTDASFTTTTSSAPFRAWGRGAGSGPHGGAGHARW